MDVWIYYIPMVVFGITVVSTGGLINLKNPKLVRRPGGLWSPIRAMNDDEWTPEGLIARRRLVRALALGLAFGVISWLLVLSISSR